MFYFCDPNHDSMTMIYENDLDILAPKMKFLGQSFQKLGHEQNRQTDTHTDRCNQMHYHTAFAGGKTLQYTQSFMH